MAVGVRWYKRLQVGVVAAAAVAVPLVSIGKSEDDEEDEIRTEMKNKSVYLCT